MPTRSYSGDLVVRWNGLSQNSGDGAATVEVDVGADGAVDFVAFAGQVRSVSFGRAFSPGAPLEVEIAMVSEAFGTTLSAFHGIVELQFVPDGLTVAPGRFQSVGFGCPSSTGLAPFLVEAPPLTGPLVGEDFVVEVRQLPPTLTMSIGLLGLSPIPPADLAPLGAPFCFLFQAAPVAVALPAPDFDGILRWGLGVPDQTELLGFTFHQQALLFDPGANALGAVVSNAGVSTIGGR